MKEKTVQTDNTTPLLQISSIQSNRVLGRTQVFFFFFFFYRIYLHIAQEKQPGNGLRRPLQVVSNLAADDVGPPQE